jgi:hypothetical protein
VPLVALALLLLIPLVVIALMPLILIQRFRMGRARRPARPWLATINVIAMVFSAMFFLAGVAVTTLWVPGAFEAALIGLAAGGVLGAIGIRLSRWESGPSSLYYTPNQWLVLAITVTVAARLLYGLWRSWAWWAAGGSATSLPAAFGVTGSLGAAAIVIGYYLAYSIGVRGRVRRWQLRSLRTGLQARDGV